MYRWYDTYHDTRVTVVYYLICRFVDTSYFWSFPHRAAVKICFLLQDLGLKFKLCPIQRILIKLFDCFDKYLIRTTLICFCRWTLHLSFQTLPTVWSDSDLKGPEHRNLITRALCYVKRYTCQKLSYTCSQSGMKSAPEETGPGFVSEDGARPWSSGSRRQRDTFYGSVPEDGVTRSLKISPPRPLKQPHRKQDSVSLWEKYLRDTNVPEVFTHCKHKIWFYWWKSNNLKDKNQSITAWKGWLLPQVMNTAAGVQLQGVKVGDGFTLSDKAQ